MYSSKVNLSHQIIEDNSQYSKSDSLKKDSDIISDNSDNKSDKSRKKIIFLTKTKPVPKKQRNSRRKEIRWSIEEDFILFEAHEFFQNKWVKYSSILKNLNKTFQEAKNHFHTCIVKTVRRILNKKYNFKLKDVLRILYSIKYINSLIDEIEGSNQKFCNQKNTGKKQYAFNPYLAIKNGLLTKETINVYTNNLLQKILYQNSSFKSFIQTFQFQEEKFNITNFNIFFFFFIKHKLLFHCLQNYQNEPKEMDNEMSNEKSFDFNLEANMTNPNSVDILKNYIIENLI